MAFDRDVSQSPSTASSASTSAGGVAVAFGAAALTAVLAYFGTGLHPLWPLLWLAPIPVLVMAPRVRPLIAFVLATVAWLAGGCNLLGYFRNVLGTSSERTTLVALAIIAIPACAFGLVVLLFRDFAKRGASIAAALAFPASWVSYEYLTEIGSPHGTFGNLSYTQMSFLPVVQLAAIGGVWLVSFAVLFFPAAVAALLQRKAEHRRALLAIAAALYVAVFAFGFWRLQPTPAAATVKVGLIASDLPANVFPLEPGPESGRLYRDYLAQAEALVRHGAGLIVIPEKLAVMVSPDTRGEDALFQSFADRHRADVVAGVIHIAKPVQFNEARMYVPSAAGPLRYEKQHMLPAFESKLKPGDEPLLVSRPSGTWGVAICKDMDFPSLGRTYGRAGAGLMLVPAWDFGDDGWLHGRMAVMRGVESGFTIARSPKDGLLTVTDDRARVLAEQRSGSASFATVLAEAPVRHEPTVYLRFGDWFAWLTLALLAFLLGIRPAV